MLAESPLVLTDAIRSLAAYCRENQWAGYDPYDGLNSRLFAKTPFVHTRVCRLALTQLLKRLPVNVRPLLLVPREQNPKGIALFTSTMITLSRLGLSDPEEARGLADRLLELGSPGVDYDSWGYNFAWQTRTYLVPKRTPNIICTTFAGNALLDAYDAFRIPRYLQAAKSAGQFLLKGLNRSGNDGEACFSYTPLDQGQVHNANLLGAAFLARLYTKTDHQPLLKEALTCAKFSIRRQRRDGSWVYGEGPKQQWIDSFHTGYNLLALKELLSVADDESIKSSIHRGFDFYVSHFLCSDGRVKYFHDRVYPLDAHALAHGILTLVEMRQFHPRGLELAERTFRWVTDHMRSDKGWYYYQKWPMMTTRISYMRWSQAWILFAFSRLAEALHSDKTPQVDESCSNTPTRRKTRGSDDKSLPGHDPKTMTTC